MGSQFGFTEGAIITYIIDGLRNNTIRNQLRLNKHESVVALLDTVRYFNSFAEWGYAVKQRNMDSAAFSSKLTK